MIKVEVVEKFTLKDFAELKNIVRKGKEEKGKLFPGDTFECTEEMGKYLTGDNPLNKAVVKVIEVVPKPKVVIKEIAVELPREEKPKKKKAKK